MLTDPEPRPLRDGEDARLSPGALRMRESIEQRLFATPVRRRRAANAERGALLREHTARAPPRGLWTAIVVLASLLACAIAWIVIRG